MKKTFRIAFVLALAALVLSAAALAAGPSIEYRGGGSFDFAPGSGYTDTDLFESFKNVMPGDVLTETITFTNSDADCDYVKLYIRAEAHDELTNDLTYDEAFENTDGKDEKDVTGERDENVVSMGQFLSQLSMKVWNGTELIYEASPDDLDGLKDNVLLGEFRKGDTAELKVELTVLVELGNEYAYRVGEVDWVFHVDALDDPEPTPTPGGSKPSKTGDDAMPILWLALALSATTAAVVLTKKKRKN